MPLPGGLFNLSRDPRDVFPQRLRDLEERIRRLETARTMDNASVGGNGMQSENFNGSLVPAAVGTQGWGLAGKTGDAIFNNLLLRGGIIGNDALTSPVAVDLANGLTSGLTFTNVVTTYDTEVITVPPGFSQALIICVATIGMTATGAGGTGLFCVPRIAGVDGDSIAASCAASGAMSVTAPQARLVTGLSGGTVSVAARASVNVPANVVAASCSARLSATVVFLR